MPTYDGVNCFGAAVHVQHIPNASAEQINSFFGVDGTVAVYGGSRGRVFHIEGVLFGGDLSELLAAEAFLLSYADGIGRVLVDDSGRVFGNVYYRGEYIPSPDGPKWTDQGVCLPYHAVFYGLT
jgi:hypothetical protein